MKEYLKILETDIYAIVKNIDAWQNSRKMNENKVSETNCKLIKKVLRIMLMHLVLIFLKYYLFRWVKWK